LSALVLNCVLASSDAQLKLSAPLVSAFVRSLWVSMEHSEGQSKQMAARTADRAQLYISHRIRLLAARFKQCVTLLSFSFLCALILILRQAQSASRRLRRGVSDGDWSR
jgi:hypothetical protein